MGVLTFGIPDGADVGSEESLSRRHRGTECASGGMGLFSGGQFRDEGGEEFFAGGAGGGNLRL